MRVCLPSLWSDREVTNSLANERGGARRDRGQFSRSSFFTSPSSSSSGAASATSHYLPCLPCACHFQFTPSAVAPKLSMWRGIFVEKKMWDEASFALLSLPGRRPDNRYHERRRRGQRPLQRALPGWSKRVSVPRLLIAPSLFFPSPSFSGHPNNLSLKDRYRSNRGKAP